MACHRGHERIVKLLLRCGANVDAKDKKDETPQAHDITNSQINFMGRL